jgi:hypothetical protein
MVWSSWSAGKVRGVASLPLTVGAGFLPMDVPPSGQFYFLDVSREFRLISLCINKPLPFLPTVINLYTILNDLFFGLGVFLELACCISSW